MLEFGQRYLEDDFSVIARVLLSVAAIVVPLFLAFVVQRFLPFREQQIRRWGELGTSQDRLKEYRRAIHALGMDLESTLRRRGVEIDHTRSRHDLLHDPKSWDDPDGTAKLYITAFRDFGRNHWHQPEFTHTEELLTPEAFDALFEALEQCASLFVRRKYWAPVLRSLGIQDQNDWVNVKFCTDRVRFDVPLSLQSEGEDVTTMGFWDRILTDAYFLMMEMAPGIRMLTAAYPVPTLATAVALAVLGIVVPLAVLAVDMPELLGFYITYATLLLFVGVLMTSLVNLWRWVRRPLL